MRDLNVGAINKEVMLGYLISIEDKFKNFMFNRDEVFLELVNTTVVMLAQCMDREYGKNLYESDSSLLKDDQKEVSPEYICWRIIGAIESMRFRDSVDYLYLLSVFKRVSLLKIILFDWIKGDYNVPFKERMLI